MNNHPLISIVMPMYNVEHFISKAIESIINQTFTNWELIIVNDGSTDNSRNISQQYSLKDSRIKIVDKENGGLSDARNFGAQKAIGDYIHFIDSDDWIETDCYEKLLPLFSKHLDFIIFGYFVDQENSKQDLIRQEIKECLNFDFSQAHIEIDKIIASLLPYIDFAWNKLYRKDFLQKNNLTFCKGLSRVEDCEFMSRVLQKTRNFKFIQYAGYHYMIRPRKSLSNYFDNKILNDYEIRIHSNIILYKSLGCSINKQHILLGNCAKICAQSYFHQLFLNNEKQNISFLYKEVHQLYKNKILCKYFQYIENIDIITLCIKNSLILPIIFIYMIKKHIIPTKQ